MKIAHDQLIEGIDYRKLSDAERMGMNRAWKYILLRDIQVYPHESLVKERYNFRDYEGRRWGRITPNLIEVRKGYAWDGSTCSPDAGAMLGSVVHDVLYQYSGLRAFPLTRWTCDNIFYALLTTPLKSLYRIGLFVGGWKCFAKPPNGLWIEVL